MRRNVLKFHYEEIVFILMILATDLKDYVEGDLMNFEEAILRLDSLADKEFLKQLKQINTKLNNYVINRIIKLKSELYSLYDSNIYEILSEENRNTKRKWSIISRQLLMRLNEEYTEPTKYAEKHMDWDWD